MEVPYSGKFSKGLIFENFKNKIVKHYRKYFLKLIMSSCTCTSGMFYIGLRIMALLKYIKCIEPSKEERIQSVLPKPDCPLAHLMPNSAIETANS